MGLAGDELEGLKTGALLHDIGKLGVPEYILLKPGRLSDDEFAKIKKHPEIGAAILGPVEFPWPVLPVVKYHHEKWDGSGYPEGLAGKNIPLTARILSVADVYDALTSTRSYRTAWEHDRAVVKICEEAGSHFDPEVVAAFERVIGIAVAELAAEGATETPTFAEGASTEPAKTNASMAVRQIQQASSELWALYEVAQSLSSSLGLQETLDILAKKLEAIAAPGAAYAFLLFDGSDSTQMRTRCVTGVNSAFLRGSHTTGEGSISRQVATKTTAHRGPYDPADLTIVAPEAAPAQNLRSALIVPIAHEGAVLGTINAYHPDPNAFNDHDADLLQMIAERSAMAIYNGLMFDLTRSHAMTDQVTGLYNFRFLTQFVGELNSGPEIEREPFALLCLDLDDFKPINDNFGHQKGDEVLRDMGVLLRNAVRSTDIVTRYGGDEFLILLRDTDRDRAKLVAQTIRAAVDAYDPGLEHPTIGTLRIGASLGWSCSPNDGCDCTSLLAAADAAMYRDKTERKLRRLAGPESFRLPRAA
jgi:diguanylate cyclase (GGDEF)-like protein